MKLHLPIFAFLVSVVPHAQGAETATLTPSALKAIAIAGDAGAPTLSIQNVGASYEVRARDFASGAVRNNLVYQRFDLSPLGKILVQGASLRFNRVAGDTLTTGRFALYGLKDLSGNLAQNWTSTDFKYGAEFDPAMYYDLIASSGLCPINLANVVDFSQQEAVSGSSATLSSADFVTFLQGRIDAGGQATVILGMPSQGAGNDKKMTFAYAGYTDPTLAVSLVLSYSAVALPSPPTHFLLEGIAFSANPTLTIDWEPIDGALSYNIYRRAAGETEAELVASTPDASYLDENVTLFGTYYYSVEVVTPNGQSVPSAEFEVRVIDASMGVPPAPDGLRTTATAQQSVDLAWNTVPGTLFYQLFRSTEADGAFTLVQTLGTSATSDTEGLKNYRSYFYRVKSVTPGGISKYSPTLTVAPRFVSGKVPPRPRHLTSPSSSLHSIDVSWDAVAGAQAYYVYRSTEEHGDYALVGITEANSLSDNYAVFPQNGYYYTVAAVGPSGFSHRSEALQVDRLLSTYKQAENLNHAPVAIPTEQGVYLGWRLLGTDRDGLGFRIYRDGRPLNHHPLRDATNFLDTTGTASSRYELRETFGLFELPGSEPVTMLPNGYLSIPIQAPAGGITPDGLPYTYSAGDASVGDLDADGRYEIVLKWDPSNAQDNSIDGYTGNVILDAYELDGTLLWRIDLGHNIRAGAHYTPFVVYDLDGDGRAEVLCRTADGTIDGQGVVIGDDAADFRTGNGRILSGPEFLTVFDGPTGAALDTIDYVPPRGNVTDWGDNYGNRSDRFNAGVAYLDGIHPSAYFERGYYHGQSGYGEGITVVAAFGMSEGRLINRWVFDTRVSGSAYVGQGNHQVVAADVDGDGKDEVALGSLVLDDDGSVLYSTNLGHGDAMHIGDFDPRRPGLEMFSVKEETTRPFQTVLTDAANGNILWGAFNGRDTGRGLIADLDPEYAGCEAWGAANANMWEVKGTAIGQRRPSMNFAIWWDGDPMRELLDDTSVRKWDWLAEKEVILLNASGAASNNGTKATPSLQADLLGDWREEVLLRSADNTELRIYTTSEISEHRIPTLMHDPQYRVAVAAQNSGYNQPPHPSFFIGNDMPPAPRPSVFVSPSPEFLGFLGREGHYVTPVLVMLNVNASDGLRNEYNVDGGAWTTYAAPFLIHRRGHHLVTFRTLDLAGNLLAENTDELDIGGPCGRTHHPRWLRGPNRAHPDEKGSPRSQVRR
jgi:fibronectin type 3 domain-containing protein